jgi:hypothetical protein
MHLPARLFGLACVVGACSVQGVVGNDDGAGGSSTTEAVGTSVASTGGSGGLSGVSSGFGGALVFATGGSTTVSTGGGGEVGSGGAPSDAGPSTDGGP